MGSTQRKWLPVDISCMRFLNEQVFRREYMRVTECSEAQARSVYIFMDALVVKQVAQDFRAAGRPCKSTNESWERNWRPSFRREFRANALSHRSHLDLGTAALPLALPNKTTRWG